MDVPRHGRPDFFGAALGLRIRAKSPTWPVPSEYLGILLSSIATFLLICSSVTMVLAQLEGELRQPKMLKYLLLTALGGIIFLSIEHEYQHLAHSADQFCDFLHGPPQFASTFFIITRLPAFTCSRAWFTS